MDIKLQIQNDFGLPGGHIKNNSSEESLCLVQVKWLQFLYKGLKIPDDLKGQDLDENTINMHFHSNSSELDSEWKLLIVNCWQKKDRNVNRFSNTCSHSPDFDIDISYSHLIHYVTKTNYKNLWEQAWCKYHSTGELKRIKQKQSFNDVLRDIITHFCKNEDTKHHEMNIHQRCSELASELKGFSHLNLVQLESVVERDDYFYLFRENNRLSLHNCLMFSPSVLEDSTLRPLFVVYQLLEVFCYVQNSGLFMGDITLSDIAVQKNLWLQVFPLICKELYDKSLISSPDDDLCDKYADSHELHYGNSISKKREVIDRQSNKASKHFVENQNSDIIWDAQYLFSKTQNWAIGHLSNFDYIMALNKIAGRMMGNPRCHPIMPWIMDFTVPEGGWRDLSKSKFRLNKGDKQLDLIYESASESYNAITNGSLTNVFQDSAIMVPHHTSEVLTDITYYVYKARIMPKSFLCQHVRRKWVPAEYPSTMERLQEWTPDECIPEFFSDPTIFYSIHPDLSDLGIPWWSTSPEDFIKKHRDALESCYVSERLHHWIDLTFGYKLTGCAAVKSKNVCLPLADQHSNIRNYGMVKLFSHPHPLKLIKSLRASSWAPMTFRVIPKISEVKDIGDDETSSESSGKTSFLKGLRSKSVPAGSEQPHPELRPENQKIVLPKDFNPITSFSQLETLYTFLSWIKGGHISKEMKEPKEAGDILTCHYQAKDMLVLGCLIAEISLGQQMKSLSLNIPLKERYDNLITLLQIHKHIIPRCFQSVIQLLLQLTPTFSQLPASEKRLFHFPMCYPPVSKWGLPTPSAHQLLLPHVHTIPFPSYFSKLYSFVLELNKYSSQIQSMQSIENDKEHIISKIADSKVAYAATRLQTLLPLLSGEGIDILIPYLQEMFENRHSALLATWHLFGIVSQALGPQQTCRKFLIPLTKVFDTDKPSPKHIKLYHRTFLLQLIIGLGLHTFLTHFTTILIEAIGGCKDYVPEDTERESTYIETLCLDDDQSAKTAAEFESFSHVKEFKCEDKINLNNLEKKFDASQEVSQIQSAIENEEDNEIYDFEMNDEVIKENNDENSADISQQNSKRWISDHETDIMDDSSGETSCDHANVFENAFAIAAQSRTSSKDFMYSKSAPNLISHLEQMPCFPKSDNQDGEKQITTNKTFVKVLQCCEDNTNFFNNSSSALEENVKVSDVSAESMLWLAHRLGPVLTARHLTRNLLRMLTLCYDSSEKRDVLYLPPGNTEVNMLSISCKWLKGDINAVKVLECLSGIASLYGEHFILLQYFKHIGDLLNLCKKRVPAVLDSGLLGAMALFQHVIPCLSDVTLMDNLQDILNKDLLNLILRLISSSRIVFPGGGKTRLMITYRMLDIIYIIGLRIGSEMTRKHLSNILQKFFACFDKIYNINGEMKDVKNLSSSSCNSLKEQAIEEICFTFTPELAFLTYIPFSKLADISHMQNILKNDELIRCLCINYDQNMSINSSGPSSLPHGRNERDGSIDSCSTSHRRDHSLGQEDSFVSGVFGKNINVVGNRLDVNFCDENHLITTMEEPVHILKPSFTGNQMTNIPKYDMSLLKRKMENRQRHLKGNWLAYWEHETGRSEKDQNFDFKQIKLQTFIGHTGAVRTIQVLDNENSFLTSSKDKTVKLWSLRSSGDGSAQVPCQWTYTQHRKSVFAVSFLDSLRLVGSCDSTVHIWDPFLGSCIKQFEPTKGSPVTVLTAMPSPSMTFLAATTNSTVRFLDARTCRYMHEFKVSIGTTGLIRCLAVSPNGNWLAVGHSNGTISVLDVRTGLLFGTWLGHEGEVLQLKAFNNSCFVTSSLDHSLSVWKFEETQAKCNLKGPMEPVTSLCFYGSAVISGTAGNRIGLHSSIDRKAMYSSTRLRSDTFKGMLTTMALLPLNRLLILGADNGNVVLLS